MKRREGDGVRTLEERLEIAEHRIFRLEAELARLREVATVDPETEFYNSSYFDHRLDEEMKRAERSRYPLSLVIIELSESEEMPQDVFRRGEEKPAYPMRRLGEILREATREVDIKALFEDDKVALLLPDTSREGAHCVVDRLKTWVGAKIPEIPEEGGTRGAAVRFGASTYPTNGVEKETFVNQALFGLLEEGVE